MSDLLTDRYLTRRAWLSASMRRAFPSATDADVEEALQDMWVDLRTRALPLPTHPERLDGLMRCVAWRRLRGRFRKLSSRLERCSFDEVGSQPAGQELPSSHISGAMKRAVPKRTDFVAPSRSNSARATPKSKTLTPPCAVTSMFV